MYLDFRKAFDAVPHQRLLKKLAAYGVGGKLLNWIAAFLTERKQQVIVDDKRSDWAAITSGVPQGSVLGPVLFVMFINDLPSGIGCSLKMFADDTKVYSKMSSALDQQALQDDINRLAAWSDCWQMPFNEGKCKVLHIGTRNEGLNYTMRNTDMAHSLIERDLGVQIDSELKFRQHAAAAVAKASQVLAVIKKSFEKLDKTTLPLLYKTMVRPHLEYANVIWGPFNRADQRKVERIQRRATRLCRDVSHLSYPERLRALRLPSLYYRRRRGDMIQVFQIIHGGVDLETTNFFTISENRRTRGHQWKLVKPRAVSRVREHAFSARTINDWNSLPTEVVNATSGNFSH